jgi:hypothetical protein
MTDVFIDCSIAGQSVVGERLHLTVYPSYKFTPLVLWMRLGSEMADNDYCIHNLDRWYISYNSGTKEIATVESGGDTCIIV